MAAALPVMMAVSAGVQAIGAIQQGRAAKRAADYNAAIDTQNAQIAREDAALQAAQQDRENRLRAGAIRAAGGASGLTSDSVFDVLGDAAAQGELQKQYILYQGEQRARGYVNTASLERMSGKQALSSSYFQAGSDLLSGGAKAYGAMQRLG